MIEWIFTFAIPILLLYSILYALSGRFLQRHVANPTNGCRLWPVGAIAATGLLVGVTWRSLGLSVLGRGVMLAAPLVLGICVLERRCGMDRRRAVAIGGGAWLIAGLIMEEALKGFWFDLRLLPEGSAWNGVAWGLTALLFAWGINQWISRFFWRPIAILIALFSGIGLSWFVVNFDFLFYVGLVPLVFYTLLAH